MAPEMEKPKPEKRNFIMKILKGSLVAAFLTLGMWAAQASACNCNGFNPSVGSGLCEEVHVCAGYDCGPVCDRDDMQAQCCTP
uniref:Uncharacterized protein n=1 Tax=Candidatus Kentrum sp. UNK TaxID=2126344 RepID=A0A451AC56_9GAMM|nr:MAG: hypothetical protein BECKUNK1418G_GA0071005_10351 [Candidatus Kentron sp. UNK]VFK70863.1 MAG: hypothetical protein BECKUNK1418H_GA0071006_10411 [Candidatus Kentron sp. UNK]